MNVSNMRDILKDQTIYSGSRTWTRKVDCMHDRQVMAIYYRLKESGGILPTTTNSQIRMSFLK